MADWVKYLGAAIILAALWGWHESDVTQKVADARVDVIATYQKKLDASVVQAQKDSKALQADKDKSDAELQSKIKTLDGKLSSALDELSKRPKRPTSSSNTPNSPSTQSACTGAQLYREDGEFLTREADRAQRVLEERDYYYERYESVRRRLDEATNME